MKKALVTLRIGDYEPEIWKITQRFMEMWARKISAEFIVITERHFPDWPASAEKFQLQRITQHFDWTYFLDADAFISPDTPDWAEMIQDKSVVIFNGIDNRLDRFSPTPYSRRSQSRVGACTWNVICSDWTGPDLWQPPADFKSACSMIHPIWDEAKTGHFPKEHLIDDLQLSDNIARYGLRVKTITQICQEMGRENGYYCHLYNCTSYKKLRAIRAELDSMGIAY